jgi:hypothetical protein
MYMMAMFQFACLYDAVSKAGWAVNHHVCVGGSETVFSGAPYALPRSMRNVPCND